MRVMAGMSCGVLSRRMRSVSGMSRWCFAAPPLSSRGGVAGLLAPGWGGDGVAALARTVDGGGAGGRRGRAFDHAAAAAVRAADGARRLWRRGFGAGLRVLCGGADPFRAAAGAAA